MQRHAALWLTAVLGGCGPAAAGGSQSPVSESTSKVEAGWIAPNFSLPAVSGQRFELHSALARGPVVLVFYRGHW